MRWGLVPHWSKGPDNRYFMINARAETLVVKSAFCDPFARSRCLIPATGYYEWKKEPDAKQPYFLCPREAGLFSFAGMWDEWQGEGVLKCPFDLSMSEANEILSPIHERMPVIIDPDQL